MRDGGVQFTGEGDQVVTAESSQGVPQSLQHLIAPLDLGCAQLSQGHSDHVQLKALGSKEAPSVRTQSWTVPVVRSAGPATSWLCSDTPAEGNRLIVSVTRPVLHMHGFFLVHLHSYGNAQLTKWHLCHVNLNAQGRSHQVNAQHQKCEADTSQALGQQVAVDQATYPAE